MTQQQIRHESPDYGGKLGHAIFHITIKFLGVYPAYLLLYFIMPYYVFILQKPRKSALYYINHRFPNLNFMKRNYLVFRYFIEFGKVLVDQAAVGILGRKSVKVKFPGWESLLKLARQKRGMVLLTSHAGAWQTAMSTMFNLSIPVHFLLQIDPHTRGRHFFELSGQKNLFNIISPNAFLGGMVEMTNALLKGDCVSIMGDRAWGAPTVETLFLGEKAGFPITPYHLIASTKKDLVVLLTSRTGRLSFSIEYFHVNADSEINELPREQLINELLKRYVKCLETYLDKNPFMWFNFFNIWE